MQAHQRGARRQRMQHGQAMVEYVVVVGALAFALFYPIQDAVSPDQPRTAVQILVNGFRQAYDNISAALSLPE